MPEKIKIPEGTKRNVSKFKSERVVESSTNSTPLANTSSPNIFMGQVKERQVTKSVVKDIIVGNNKQGFPSMPSKNVNLGSSKKAVPDHSNNLPRNSVEEYKSNNKHPDDSHNISDDKELVPLDDSVDIVSSMTPEEVEASIKELCQYLTPETMQFLKERGLKEINGKKEKKSSIDRKRNDMSFGLEERSSKNHFQANTLEELAEVQSDASEAVRQNLAWTKPSPSNIKNDVPVINRSKNEMKVSATERFDLHGVRVMDISVCERRIMRILNDSFLANIVPINSLDIICKMCMQGMAMIGLCVDSKVVSNAYATSSEPQHELGHHETDMQSFGYTLKEACEVSH
jgi:hypothetical protein